MSDCGGGCCCGQGTGASTCSGKSNSVEEKWITGYKETPAGSIPRVSTELTFSDRIGSWKARWGIGRMDYAVEPGLYCIGEPDENSYVLVTANYKMTF